MSKDKKNKNDDKIEKIQIIINEQDWMPMEFEEFEEAFFEPSRQPNIFISEKESPSSKKD